MGEVWNTRENTRFKRNGRVPRASQRPKTWENTRSLYGLYRIRFQKLEKTRALSITKPITPRNASRKARKELLKGRSRRHWRLEVWRYWLPRLASKASLRAQTTRKHEVLDGKGSEIKIRIDTSIQKFPQGQLRSRTHQAETSWFRIRIYAMRL